MKYNLEILDNKVCGDSIDALLLQLDKLASSKDYDSLVEGIKCSIQALDPEFPIILEEDENQSFLAHLEYGRHHHTPYHKVVYKKSFVYWQHSVVHELMHLEMYIKASKAGKGNVFKKNKANDTYFKQTFGAAFRKLIPRYGTEMVEGLQKMVQDGIITQLLSCPLDLFVEQHIHDRYKDIAVLQLLSLLHQERTNIGQYSEPIVALMPPKIVSVNKTLCLINSMRLKEFYGLDFLDCYKTNTHERKQSVELYQEYHAYKNTYNDGDEYELFDYFSEALGVENVVNRVKE